MRWPSRVKRDLGAPACLPSNCLEHSTKGADEMVGTTVVGAIVPPGVGAGEACDTGGY